MGTESMASKGRCLGLGKRFELLEKSLASQYLGRRPPGRSVTGAKRMGRFFSAKNGRPRRTGVFERLSKAYGS